MQLRNERITATLRRCWRVNRRGMTLVEVMISGLIAVFILSAFLLLLSSSRSSWLVSQVQSDLYVSGRKAIHMMFRELGESSFDYCSAVTFLDPLSGQYRQTLCFLSGRGDPAVAGEDGSSTNDYVHINANGDVNWRSLVVFCPYVTADNNVQLRRYVDYGAYSNSDFPVTLSVTPLNIIVVKNGGAGTVTFSRAAGTVLANYLGSEDSNNNNVLDANENNGNTSLPIDNANGILNLGANFVKGNGVVEITLFLSREVTALHQAGRFLASTVRAKVKLRQPEPE